MTLCPEDFSKSGISATIAGCKATAHRSLISAALAVLPAVMPNKVSPNATVTETLRMLRRFMLSLPYVYIGRYQRHSQFRHNLTRCRSDGTDVHVSRTSTLKRSQSRRTGD